MYIQENLTTTPHEVPGVSWELSPEHESKFWQYGAFSKLVFNEDKTAVIDITEDTDKKTAFEQERAAEIAAENAKRQAAALEKQGVQVMARAMFRTAAANLSSDEVIQCRALADEWLPGAFAVGDVRTENGVPYRCCQAHDASANPEWTPSAAPALWAAYHGTTPETALPWAQPSGAHDLYKIGECMVWRDGKTYCAAQDNSFGPDAFPAGWEEISV